MSLPHRLLTLVEPSRLPLLKSASTLLGTEFHPLSGTASLGAALRERWDVLVVSAGAADPFAVLEATAQHSPGLASVVLAESFAPGEVLALMRMGARDCLRWDELDLFSAAVLRATPALRHARSDGGATDRGAGGAIGGRAALFGVIDAVRRSIDPEDIFRAAVQGARELLAADRALVYRFDADFNGSVAAESVAPGWTPSLGLGIKDTCFRQTKATQYAANRVVAVDDVRSAGFTPCHLEMLEGFQVRANAVVPILFDGQVWGLFIVHQCSAPRRWWPDEIEALYQVGAQLTIALQQAELYRAGRERVFEMERLVRLKDDFLSTVSHELRTPMTNIKVAAHMLRSQQNLGKYAGYLDILESECDREIRLINDLLDLQRLDCDTTPASTETLALGPWLSGVLAPFAERARLRRQVFSTKGLEDLGVAAVPAGALERVVAELLGNACKYTPEGECIAVRFALENGSLSFAVANSGALIPPEELPRVFERFHRVPGGDPWKQGGTGLGLALVRRTLDVLGGEIRAESNAVATVFSARLPLGTAPGLTIEMGRRSPATCCSF